MEKRSTRLAQLGLLYCAAIWGSTFVLVKQALTGIDALALVGYRFVLAALLVLPILIIQRTDPFKHFRQGLFLGLVLAALYLPQTLGLYITSAANSAFITGLFVAFIPLLAPFFAQRSTRREWLAVLVALLGLFALTGGLARLNWGDVITLAAALTYALHVLLTGQLAGARVDPYRLSFQQFIVVGVASLVLAALFERPFAFSTSSALWTVLFLAAFPTASSFVIQIFAQRHVPPVRTALIFTLEPVFAALFAWTVGGELLTVSGLVGGLLIVAAMVISAWQPRPAAGSPSSA